MEKKLPGVYPGKVRKDAGNNAKMTYVGNNTEETVKNEPKEPANELNISQKINQIFYEKRKWYDIMEHSQRIQYDICFRQDYTKKK